MGVYKPVKGLPFNGINIFYPAALTPCLVIQIFKKANILKM
jgi:hypothetical protein